MTGSEFKQIRKALGLTQPQLAERMGYAHRVSISQFEASDEVPAWVAAHIRCIAQIDGKADM